MALNKKNAKMEAFINNYSNYLVNQEILQNKEEVEYFFTMGGCYMFGRILKHFFPKSKLMIDNKKKHCTVKYGGKIYDIRGEIEGQNFHNAYSKDITYMKEHFGFVNFRKNSQDDFVQKTIEGFKLNTNLGFTLTIN